jgi:hypothetical protein
MRCLIATPCYDSTLSAFYVNSLIKTINLGKNNNIDFDHVFVTGDSLVQRARNTLISKAYYGQFDAILWIDSDIEWNPMWAVDFCKSDLDVLSAAYPIKTDSNEQYPIKINSFSNEKIIKVIGCGMGFTKMSNKAIDYLWNLSEEYLDEGDLVKNIFEVVVKDNDLYSEDIVVCEKLSKGGFDINLDTTKTCNHIGTYKYRGDFSEYIKNIQFK